MATSEVVLARGGVSQFVGRAREIAWLRQLLSEAAGGEMRVALVKGEPGVGKTRLLREFLSVADGLGWQTVSGHCSLDAASVHLPFATGLAPQMVRAGILAADGSDAPRGEDLPMLAANLAGKTVELAARRQLVFSIDDYQFGEPSTLRLIGEYVRNLCEVSRREPLRLLVIIAHHPPLSGDAFAPALDQLRREPQVHATELTGLEEVEVHELIREASATPCDPRLLGAVVEATNGNPLFVMEVLRDLDRRHLLTHENGHLATSKVNELHLPTTASSALSQRLESADPEVLELVQAGALLGDSFGLDEVAALLPGKDLEAAADRAIGLGLLQADRDGVSFCHGMVRTAVAESISPMRRRRMHREIAEGLLGRYGASENHAIETASHVAAAGTWPDATEAGEIYVRAGDVALATFMWGTAQRFFEAALAVEGYVGALDAVGRGWLYARAARSNGNNGNKPRSRELYCEALAQFRGGADYTGWGLALLGWWRTFSAVGAPIPDDGAYEEFSAAAADEVLDVRSQLLTHRAQSLWAARDPRDLDDGREAFELSQLSRDGETRSYGALVMGLILNRRLRPDEAIEHFRLSVQEAKSTGNPRLTGWGMSRLPMPLITMGDLAAARRICEEERILAREGHDLGNGPLNLAVFHVAAILSGDQDLARRCREEGAMLGTRTTYPSASFILDSSVAWDRMLRGELQEAGDALDSWERSGGRSVARSLRLLLAARSGGASETSAELGRQPLSIGTAGVDFTNLGAIAAAAEMAADLCEREVAERMLELLEPLVRQGIVFSVTPPILVPRAAAAAARVCGRTTQARDLIEIAHEVADRAGAGPELGLVALEKARILLADGAPAPDVAAAVATAASMFRAQDMVGATELLLEFAVSAGLSTRLAGTLATQDDLSATEMEIIEGLAGGKSTDELADALLLHSRSVDGHLDRLERRLGVRDADSAGAYLRRTKEPAKAGKPSVRPELAELTPRELEVLGLVARGLTNQQIADELVISLHTAIRHVANILGKTGAANRTEAARLTG